MPKYAYNGRLSVVVPIRNEQDNIEPMVREVAAVLPGNGTFGILYVNNGSADAHRSLHVGLCSPTYMGWPHILWAMWVYLKNTHNLGTLSARHKQAYRRGAAVLVDVRAAARLLAADVA